MKTKVNILMVALSLIASTVSYAKTAINGLCYELNNKTLEATVVSLNEFNNDSEENYKETSFVVPAEITYDNKTYKVTAIEIGAFAVCSNLTSITLPNTIKHIGSSAFSGCKKLAFVTLPNSIKRIEPETFGGCESLKSITIPEGVTTIAQYSIDVPSSIESITLPSTLKFISPEAFFGVTSIKSVIVKSPTLIALYKNSFPVFGNLYVPKGSKEAYEKAAIWQNFNIIEGEPTGIENLQATLDSQPSPIFTLSGQRISTPRKGLVIIKGKKVVVK